MVDKTRQVDPGKLTAYERWELPNIGGQKQGPNKLTNTAPQKIKPLTAQDLEDIRKQAYDAGFEEGRKAGSAQGHKEGLTAGKTEGHQLGLEQGLAAGQSQINATVAKLDILLAELVVPLSKQQTLVEEAMLNVSMAVARAVIHRELSLDSSSIQQAIHSILNDLPKADKGFSLKINSKDEAFITPILKRYDAAISLKIDNTITPGGCVLNSSNQLIDYTIEKRFQKTVQAMLTQALQSGSAQSSVEVPSSIGALSDYPSETLEDIGVEDDVDIETGDTIVSDKALKDETNNNELPSDGKIISPESDAVNGDDHDK